MNLRELINQKFDTDYPISGGTGNSVDNPIIIDGDEGTDLDCPGHSAWRVVLHWSR